MGYSVSLGSLVGSVQRLADVENATNRHPLADVRLRVNEAYKAYWDEITQPGYDHEITSYNVPIVVGTSTYTLPGDFSRIRGVDILIGGYTVSMREWKFDERELYDYQGGWLLDAPVAYHQLGNNLVFKPVPMTAYTTTLWYYPTAPQLATDGSQDGTAYAFPVADESFVIAEAAIKLLTKDERDASTQVAMRQDALARIRASKSTANLAEPPRIVRRSTGQLLRRGWR